MPSFLDRFTAVPLTPHPTPLTAAEARHLLRRTGVGASPSRVAAFTGLSATDAAARLLAEVDAAPVPAAPAWYPTPPATASVNDLYAERPALVRRMVDPATTVREKLALFWMNHFATEARVYNNAVRGWHVYDLVHRNLLGPLRPFVHAVGLAPAMLSYLNGQESTRTAPNQNYARELLELFTMGPYGEGGAPNYTEPDVAEIARALTGWRVRNNVEAYFTGTRYDDGQKAIFGQTSAWGYTDVMRLVFEARGPAVARFIARKLLAFYATHTPDAATEAALADVLVASGFETRPALQALWSSAAFFATQGALVRGPVDAVAGLVASLETPASFDAVNVESQIRARGESLFNPPDVAGWDGRNPPSATGRAGYAAWYESASFGPLWTSLRAVALNTSNRVPYDVLVLQRLAADPNDPFDVALAVARHLIALPLDVASIPRIEAPFAGDPAIPPPAWTQAAPPYVTDLAKLMLGAATPHYEWAGFSTASRTIRLRSYVAFLTTELPEYLLF